MKKIIIKSVLAISCFSLCLISCGKEEIPYFDSQYNAVRFNSTNEYDAETDIFKGNYSSQLYTLMYQTKYLILYYQLQGKIKPTYLRNRSVLK